MTNSKPSHARRWLTQASGYALAVVLIVASAFITRYARQQADQRALAALDARARVAANTSEMTNTMPVAERIDDVVADEPDAEAVSSTVSWPMETRWFNGRPVRPTKTLTMLVTAYSPDHRSCGRFADGQTASLHSVETHNGQLAAADSRLLPLGSMISVPGYNDEKIVPVLDRGGAIKGHRLDLLFTSHAAARAWGVRRLEVVQWEYADGQPVDDFRAIRDSKN